MNKDRLFAIIIGCIHIPIVIFNYINELTIALIVTTFNIIICFGVAIFINKLEVENDKQN